MSKLSLSVYLNAYSDAQASNNPGQNNFKWNRDLNSIVVNNPTNQANAIAPGETRDFFNGSRTLLQDNTTEYGLALKPLSTNTWVLDNVGGTRPNFRTPRTSGADATTEVTAVVNGPIVTFTSTAGTMFDLITGGAVVGDYVTVGSNFNVLNQGTYQIIGLTATSFTVEILTATNEGPVVLGAQFRDQVSIFSAAGVQAGDTLVISGGFSQASWGTYEITAVYAQSVEFFFSGPLPTEPDVLTEAITIYNNAKTLVYLESDSALHVILNGVDIGQIEPWVVPSASQPSLPPKVVPGVFMLKSTIWSLSVTNSGLSTANVYFAAVE